MSIDQTTQHAGASSLTMVYAPDPRGAAWCVLLDSSGRNTGDTEREALRTALSVYAIVASAESQSPSAKGQGKHPYDTERWKWILAGMPFLDLNWMESSGPSMMDYPDLASGLLADPDKGPTADAGSTASLLGALANAADPSLASYPHICLILEIGKEADTSELVGRVRLQLTDIKRSNGTLTFSLQGGVGEFTGFSERQKETWKGQETKYATQENLAALRAAKHYAERVVHNS